MTKTELTTLVDASGLGDEDKARVLIEIEGIEAAISSPNYIKLAHEGIQCDRIDNCVSSCTTGSTQDKLTIHENLHEWVHERGGLASG